MGNLFWIILAVGVSLVIYWLIDWESHQDKE